MSKIIKIEYIQNEIRKVGYTLLSKQYINAHAKMEIKCKNNHVFEMCWNGFQQGQRCPKCAGNKKYTLDEIKNYVEIESNSGYKLLSTEYINNSTKLKMLCPNNHEHNITFQNFKLGKRCSRCRGFKRRDTEEFKQDVFNLVGDEYVVLGEFKNTQTKILMKHNIQECGNEWDVLPNGFLSGTRCSRCFGNLTYDTDTYKQKVYELVENEYDVLGEYKRANIKIKMRHNICGFEWNIRPNNFLVGRRCPECNESKGEKKCSKILDLYNIKYIKQKIFDNLTGIKGGNLSYDFYLPDFNLLIEYQGEFHFMQQKNISKKKFEKQQEHDRRKKEYALQNKYNFLEIWYWDFNNIEEILLKELQVMKIA